ncbi:MAG TPA: hypothetical protein PLV92_23560, partial [Pirellulaceae bacterium]|nr:hypothetical protein [Pirellulaceae bacterium]
DGRVASITDPAGRVTQLSYDASGNLVRVTNPDGAERAWSYDARHLLVGEVNERGDRETTEYDFAGRATRATQADGSVRQIQPRQTQNLLPPSATINPLSPPVAASIWSPQVRFSDPIGNVLTSQLDSDGQRVAARDPAGPLPGFERNRQNLVRQASDGRGNLTLFTYDSRGNLVSVQDSLIATASTGEVLGSITEPGETDVYVFDAVAGTVGFYDSLDNDRDGVAVQLYTPSGQAMLPYSFFNSGQPDRDRGPARLPETGTYRLEIGGTGATGDYRFRLLDFADAPTLTLSAPVTGRLDTDLAAQLYRFTGTAGQHLRFDSNSTGAAIAACDWRFTDVGTGEFGFDAGGSLDQDFDTSLPAAGDYALIVSCPADTATGSPLDFQFTVQQLTDPATPASGFDIVHSGTIAAGQTVDYSFSAPAGTLIYVDSLSGTYAPLIGQIFDSTGQLITNTDVTRDAIANVADGLFTLPKSDTFTLRVS